VDSPAVVRPAGRGRGYPGIEAADVKAIAGVVPPVLAAAVFECLRPTYLAISLRVLPLPLLLEQLHRATVRTFIGLGAEHEAAPPARRGVGRDSRASLRARRARHGQHSAHAKQRERGQDLRSCSHAFPPVKSGDQQPEHGWVPGVAPSMRRHVR